MFSRQTGAAPGFFVIQALNIASQTLLVYLPASEYSLLSAPALKYRDKLIVKMKFFVENRKETK
jgi:hypothetical protein